MKLGTLKIFKEIIEYVRDIGIRKDFINKSQKAQIIKEKY